MEARPGFAGDFRGTKGEIGKDKRKENPSEGRFERGEVPFGRKELPKRGTGKVKRSDKKRAGRWKIATDIDKLLVFPIVATLQRLDIVIWSNERKIVHLLELTVPWESNLEAAEDRKEKRYQGLLKPVRSKYGRPDTAILVWGKEGTWTESFCNCSNTRWASHTVRSSSSERRCNEQRRRRHSSSG
jgi:ribosomal protein L15